MSLLGEQLLANSQLVKRPYHRREPYPTESISHASSKINEKQMSRFPDSSKNNSKKQKIPVKIVI